MSTPSSLSQPHKHRGQSGNPVLKAALLAGASLAVLGVAGLFITQAWLESYLKSNQFRQRIETGIGRHLNASVQISPLKREGISVFSDSLDSDGQPGAAYKQLKLRSLRADLDLNALWRHTWRVDFLNVQQLDLNLDAHTPLAPLNQAPPSAPAPQPGWLAQFLPNHTEIGTLKAEKAYLQKGALTAQQLRLTATQNNNDWEILAEGGEVKVPTLPVLELSNAKLVLHQKALVLRNSRFLLKKGGEATATGEFSETTGAEVHAHLENVNIEPFLSPWWQTRLKGNILGDLLYKQPAGNDSSGDLEGTLQLKGGKLEALPILSHLDSFLGNPRFRSVPLKTASAKIFVSKKHTIIRDLDLDGDGLIRITGNLVIEGDQLKGLVQLGLSPSLIQWLPGARSAIFTDKRDGYVWTSLQVSGSVDNPVEDLSSKLLESGKDAVINTIKTVIPAGTNLPEATKGVLDTLKSVLPGR